MCFHLLPVVAAKHLLQVVASQSFERARLVRVYLVPSHLAKVCLVRVRYRERRVLPQSVARAPNLLGRVLREREVQLAFSFPDRPH